MGIKNIEISFRTLSADKIPLATCPRWIVLGRSNVGKSSFLNALTHPDRYFKVGNTPGVTRGAIAVKIQIGKSPKSILELVDLPGWGYAKRNIKEQAKWNDLAVKLREDTSHPKQWLWLIDPKRKPEEAEYNLRDWLSGDLFFFLKMKSDRFNKKERAAFVKRNDWQEFFTPSIVEPFWVSTKKKEGLNIVESRMRNFLMNASEAEICLD